MSGVVGPGSGGSCSAGLVPADPAAAAAATAAAPHSPAEEQAEAAAGQADQPLAVTTETTWCSSLQRLVSRLPMLHSPAAAEPPAAAAGQGEAAAAATVALARTNQRAQQAPVAAPLAAAGMGEPQVVLATPGPTLGSFTCTFPPTAAPTVPTPAVATVEAAIEAAGQPGMGCIWHTDAEGYAEAAVRAARQRTSYTDDVDAEEEEEEEQQEGAPPLPLRRRQRGQNYGTCGVSGSGNSWKVLLRLLPVDPKPLRISGFRQAALAAAAHDHARLWLALRQAACCTDTPLAQLAAAVEVVPAAEFNFPPAEYTHDEALLVLLVSSSRQKLEEHLEPHKLAQWYVDAQAEAAAAAAAGRPIPAIGGAGAAAAVAAAATQPGAATATAPLRRDNSTKFVGVSRIVNSKHLSAAITVGGNRRHLGTYPTPVQAAVVRDIGVIWKRLHGLSGGEVLNFPDSGLDRDTGLVEQLHVAPDVPALKAVLEGWTPHNLADVADIVADAQAGGTRAAISGLAHVVQEALQEGAPAAGAGDGNPTSQQAQQQPDEAAAQPTTRGGQAVQPQQTNGHAKGAPSGSSDSYSGSGAGGGSDKEECADQEWQSQQQQEEDEEEEQAEQGEQAPQQGEQGPAAEQPTAPAAVASAPAGPISSDSQAEGHRGTAEVQPAAGAPAAAAEEAAANEAAGAAAGEEEEEQAAEAVQLASLHAGIGSTASERRRQRRQQKPLEAVSIAALLEEQNGILAQPDSPAAQTPQQQVAQAATTAARQETQQLHSQQQQQQQQKQIVGPAAEADKEHQGEPAVAALEGKQASQGAAQKQPPAEAAQQEGVEAGAGPSSGRRCLQCGSSNKNGPQWHRHPVTHEEWMCSACFNPLYNELKRSQSQKHGRKASRGRKRAQQEQPAAVQPGTEPAEEAEAVVRRSKRRQQEEPEAAEAAVPAAEELADEPGSRTRAGKQRLTVHAAAQQQRQQRQQRQRQCLQCGSTPPNGKQWYRHPATKAEWLCQRCYSRVKYHLKREQQEQERERQQERQQVQQAEEAASDSEDADQRRCLVCGSSDRRGKQWNRHPVTKQEWVCCPCTTRVRTEMRRQQQVAEQQPQQEEEEEEAGGQPVVRKRQRQRREEEAAAAHPPAKRHRGGRAAAAGAEEGAEEAGRGPAGAFCGATGSREERKLQVEEQGDGAGWAARVFRAAALEHDERQQGQTPPLAQQQQQQQPQQPEQGADTAAAQQQQPQQPEQGADTAAAQQQPQQPQQPEQGADTAAAQQQQQHQQHQHQQQHQPQRQGVLALALHATRVAAGAVTGLDQGLVGRFWALLDRLPAEQQASKVAALRMMLEQGMHVAAGA